MTDNVFSVPCLLSCGCSLLTQAFLTCPPGALGVLPCPSNLWLISNQLWSAACRSSCSSTPISVPAFTPVASFAPALLPDVCYLLPSTAKLPLLLFTFLWMNTVTKVTIGKSCKSEWCEHYAFVFFSACSRCYCVVGTVELCVCHSVPLCFYSWGWQRYHGLYKPTLSLEKLSKKCHTYSGINDNVAFICLLAFCPHRRNCGSLKIDLLENSDQDENIQNLHLHADMFTCRRVKLRFGSCHLIIPRSLHTLDVRVCSAFSI